MSHVVHPRLHPGGKLTALIGKTAAGDAANADASVIAGLVAACTGEAHVPLAGLAGDRVSWLPFVQGLRPAHAAALLEALVFQGVAARAE